MNEEFVLVLELVLVLISHPISAAPPLYYTSTCIEFTVVYIPGWLLPA